MNMAAVTRRARKYSPVDAVLRLGGEAAKPFREVARWPAPVMIVLP